MSHRYQKLLTPLVLPNGAVLKNRLIQPKCAPDQIQGPDCLLYTSRCVSETGEDQHSAADVSAERTGGAIQKQTVARQNCPAA